MNSCKISPVDAVFLLLFLVFCRSAACVWFKFYRKKKKKKGEAANKRLPKLLGVTASEVTVLGINFTR